ncbi:MAG: 1-(5-phosphoribosyl)-5-[(5-phosphoribosylamino)methylideneamino]imidazole-4-carboxamide isomerase [Candidatus Omnitrophota bacterium]
MKIIPAVDIIEGKTVRLEQGQYNKKLSYDLSPVEAARKWESLGAEMLHIVDLDGAREGKPVNLGIAREIIRQVKIPVEIGGGFRKEIDIKKALDLGITRVIIGSKAFADIDFARDCLESFKQQVIFSVDARNFELCVEGWEKKLDLDLFEVLGRFVAFGAKEIIYTDIQRDGMLSGPNIEGLKEILTKTSVKVISAGGVKTADDIRELKKLEDLGLSGVIIGRALYEGTIDLKEAIDAGKEDNSVS